MMTNSKEERIVGLDIVRATAILAVVASHSAEFLLRLGGNPRIGGAVLAWVDAARPLGLLGVELFFVLSGFLIGGILIRTFMAAPVFSAATIRNFWVRRWMRTLPLYWLILTIDIALYKVMGLSSFKSFQPLYYFFLQNLWYPHPVYFFGEAWSLAVEEWFYLTLPVALYIAARIWAPVRRRRFLLRVFAGYLLVFAAARFINAFHPINGADQDFGIRKVVIFRLDAVMYGVLMAYFNYAHKERLYKLRRYLLALCATGVLIIYYLAKDHAAGLFDNQQPVLRFMSNAFLYLCIPLIFSLCLPVANSVRSTGSRYLNKAIVHISKISYAMYLVHYSLVFMPFFYKLQLSSTGGVIGMYAAYWALVVVLSSIIYRYYEQPVLRLRDKFPK